jgi:peptidyl-prolyl cis-trans isomerase C
MLTPRRYSITALFIIIVFFLSACGLPFGLGSTPTPSPTPTSTPKPLAASVNGEGITYEELDAELARYQSAQSTLGRSVTVEQATQTVMNNLIETILLEQGAVENGHAVSDADVQSRVEALQNQMGGAQALLTWETDQGYTDEQFRTELKREMLAAWMRDEIISTVPASMEQVHVKQILLYNPDDAQQALGYLQTGWKFDDLAKQYDALTGGDLGWFPRGYLGATAIEKAAFALQPGHYSDIIQTEAGYSIIYLEELDPDRLLSPDALLVLQGKALQDWLTQEKASSTIIYAP